MQRSGRSSRDLPSVRPALKTCVLARGFGDESPCHQYQWRVEVMFSKRGRLWGNRLCDKGSKSWLKAYYLLSSVFEISLRGLAGLLVEFSLCSSLSVGCCYWFKSFYVLLFLWFGECATLLHFVSPLLDVITGAEKRRKQATSCGYNKLRTSRGNLTQQAEADSFTMCYAR